MGNIDYFSQYYIAKSYVEYTITKVFVELLAL